MNRDTITDVLNSARVRLNDAMQTLQPVSGKLLDESQAYTQQAVNLGWRRLQEFLANLGYSAFTRETILQSCPVVATLTDPSVQTYVNWDGFYDGVNLWPEPVLPDDLICPKRVYERRSAPHGYFIPMELIIDGMPSLSKQSLNLWWDWRSGAIFMPGSMQAMDLKIEYSAYLSDFVDVGTTRWYEAQIPMSMQRCLNAFAWYVCAEYSSGRDDMDEERFETKAEAAAKQIMNRDVQLKQRTNIRRQPRSGRGHSGWNSWGGW